MTNRRIEVMSTLTSNEKRILREFFSYDRHSRLYVAHDGDNFDSHRRAMMRMRRTFDVRHTHVQADGSECPCFSPKHMDAA